MENKKISLLFDNIFETINIILENDFYDNKKKIPKVKEKVKKWMNEYQKCNTLTIISAKELEFVDEEILDLFDYYIECEPVKQNYSERLYYYFGILKKEWKNEMLGEKNVRKI